MDEEKTTPANSSAGETGDSRWLLLVPLCALGMGYLGHKILPFFRVSQYSGPHASARLPAPWEMLIVLLAILLGAYLGYWLAQVARKR